jgi:hypothetical protein
VNTYSPLEAAGTGKQDSCRFLAHPARSFWNANGPLNNATSRSSRGDEAQISLETEAISEPPHVGCYFLNRLLTGRRLIQLAAGIRFPHC